MPWPRLQCAAAWRLHAVRLLLPDTLVLVGAATLEEIVCSHSRLGC